MQQDYNSSGEKIKSKGITYEKDDESNTNYARAIRADFDYICDNHDDRYDEGAAYRIYTYSYRVKSEADTLFFPNQDNTFVETKKTYNYNVHKLLKSTEEVVKSGVSNDIYMTEYKYPTDISTQTYQNMVNANRIAYPVETVTKLNNAIIKSSLLTYENLFFKSRYELQISTPLSPSVFMPYNGTQMDTGYGSPELTVVGYTDSGSKKIVEIKEKDGISTSYLWGYKGQYPIAEVKNATYDQLKNSIGEQNLQAISDKAEPTSSDLKTINSLRNSLEKAMITTYTRRPQIGILSITDPAGIATYYNYDDFGRLLWVYDNDYHTIKNYRYRYAPTPINPFYNYPPLTALFVNVNDTYTYTPGLTLTCSVSINGGSNFCSYSWTLENQLSGQQVFLEGNSFNASILPGIYTLSCVVTDNVTREIIKLSKDIVVYSY